MNKRSPLPLPLLVSPLVVKGIAKKVQQKRKQRGSKKAAWNGCLRA